MVLLILIFLCWGSFLNVLAYRLIKGESLLIPRSFCPTCKKIIYWYDNIPVISWIILKAKCRHCKSNISALYPFTELLTAVSMTCLYFTVNRHYFPAYFIFFSALIVTFRSDIEFMLISRFATLFLIPLGFLFSAIHLLPITLTNSIAGALLGYGFLFAVAKVFKYLMKKEGIGQGDLELLAFIGSFLGIIGCWISLLLGSIIGSIIGLFYIKLKGQSKQVKMPFGHFLAIGAMTFVFFEKYLISLILEMQIHIIH